MQTLSPGRVAQLSGAWSHAAKGWGFDSWSGHMPRLKVQSPVGAHIGGNQSVFLPHIDVSLCFSVSLSVSLSLLSVNIFFNFKCRF